MGLTLAGSLLMGCGTTQGHSGVEQLLPGNTPVQSDPSGEEVRGSTGESGEVTGTEAGTPIGQNQDWDRENEDSYEGLQQFCRQLMLENMEQDNPVLSPVSAYFAMGMVGMGAEGETRQEFLDVMGSNMPALSQKLMSSYPREQEGLTLTIANSVWVDEQLTPADQWLTDMQEIFHGEGYRGVLSTKQIMDQINSWCNENTRGLIPSMLSQPLDPETRLALLDAIYFKGDWERPFDAMATAERDFTREDGTKLQVETMSMTNTNQQYIHSELGEGVILPYQGEDFVYVAILPEEDSSVRQLYEALDQKALDKLLDSANTERCNLHLPKYEISFDQELNESLIAMGLGRAFDSELAELSGLGTTAQGNPLYISLVKQKAVFKVDEEGTEAAAITMVMVNETMCMEPLVEPRQLYFDRPFVYMILDQHTRIPLFVGIMDDPS